MNPEIRREINKLRQDISEVESRFDAAVDENKFADIESTVRRIDTYLISKNQESYLDAVNHLAGSFQNGTDPYANVPDKGARLQLRFDYIIMDRAAQEDDMLTFCLRAHQQVEGLVRYFLLHLLDANRDEYESAWDPFKAYNKDYTDPKLIREWSIAQLTGVTLYGLRGYLIREYYKDEDANQASLTFKNLREIRNWAVHRSGDEGPLEIESLDEYARDYFTGEERSRSWHRSNVRSKIKFLTSEILDHHTF